MRRHHSSSSPRRPIPFYAVVMLCITMMLVFHVLHSVRDMQSKLRNDKKNAIIAREYQRHRHAAANEQASSPSDASVEEDVDNEFDEQRRHNSRISVDGGYQIAYLDTKDENMEYADELVKDLFAVLPATDERRMLHPSADIRLSLFVSIVSYRDTLCRFTLRSLFSQALNPGTIFVGVVEQHSVELGDPLCVHRHEFQMDAIKKMDASRMPASDDTLIGQMKDKEARRDAVVGTFELVHAHAKVMHMPPWFGKGPAHARYLAASMYSEEAYFLMIDSHSVFSLHWDRLLIESYLQLAIKTAATSPGGPVLTHHPPAWIPARHAADDVDAQQSAADDAETFLTDIGGEGTTHHDVYQQLPYVCLAKYDLPELGYPILYSTARNRTKTPRPQPFVGAGLLFTKGEVVHDVPFDAHLEYLFHGEEILLSARLWTSGFDFYSPNEVILRHYYYRRDSAKYNNDTAPNNTPRDDELREQALAASIMRVQYLLETTEYQPPWERKPGVPPKRQVAEHNAPLRVKENEHLYGMGSERRLESFWTHCGIDPIERLQDPTRWCCRPDCPD